MEASTQGNCWSSDDIADECNLPNAAMVSGIARLIDLLRGLPGIDKALDETDLERGFFAARGAVGAVDG